MTDAWVEGIPARKLNLGLTRKVWGSDGPDGRYIKGPLSIEWLMAASQHGKAALLAGLAIHYAAGVRNQRRDISISNELAERFGLSRYTKYRVLKRLAAAGLIALTQEGKAAPRVTIVHSQGRLCARTSGARNGEVTYE